MYFYNHLKLSTLQTERGNGMVKNEDENDRERSPKGVIGESFY